jgi:hypothetical protein
VTVDVVLRYRLRHICYYAPLIFCFGVSGVEIISDKYCRYEAHAYKCRVSFTRVMTLHKRSTERVGIAATLLILIREVLGSNLGRDTG